MGTNYPFEDAEHFRSIVQNLDGYIYSVLYEEGRAVSSYNSPQCFEITGYTPEEYAADPELWIAMVFPEDYLLVFDLFHSRTHRTETNQVEHRIIRKDGTICWIQNRFTEQFDDAGKITRRDGFIIDITERRQAMQLYIESTERYKTLAENSSDLICEIGSDFKFHYVSPNFYDLLGYRPSELIHKSFLKYVHPDDLEAVKSEIKLQHGQVIHRIRQKNGEWIWLESAGKQYTTINEERRGVIVSRDITTRKHLEQQIIRNEKLLAIGEMSAVIAHQFRNALTSIKLILQIQKESNRLSKREKNSLAGALQSIYHLEEVIRQLLNFTQQQVLAFEIDNINSLIVDCIDLLMIPAQKKDIAILTNFDKRIPPLLLHQATIKETLINILLNAIHSFGPGSAHTKRAISVKTKLEKIRAALKDSDLSVANDYFNSGRVKGGIHEIVLEKGAECAVIRIADNGSGIDTTLLGHIFEPFFTTKDQGSGLGLAIAKRIVNTHGGIIHVQSKKKKGTTFLIYLPVRSLFDSQMNAEASAGGF